MQPVKSYAVAIVYARLLEKRFGEHFIEALNYPDLLLGDRYFSRYCDDWRTYDSVFALLRERKLWDFENNNLPQVKATVSYFKKEFLLI